MSNVYVNKTTRVIIAGPTTGKTTLVKKYPGKYFDMDNIFDAVALDVYGDGRVLTSDEKSFIMPRVWTMCANYLKGTDLTLLTNKWPRVIPKCMEPYALAGKWPIMFQRLNPQLIHKIMIERTNTLGPVPPIEKIERWVSDIIKWRHLSTVTLVVLSDHEYLSNLIVDGERTLRDYGKSVEAKHNRSLSYLDKAIDQIIEIDSAKNQFVHDFKPFTREEVGRCVFFTGDELSIGTDNREFFERLQFASNYLELSSSLVESISLKSFGDILRFSSDMHSQFAKWIVDTNNHLLYNEMTVAEINWEMIDLLKSFVKMGLDPMTLTQDIHDARFFWLEYTLDLDNW